MCLKDAYTVNLTYTVNLNKISLIFFYWWLLLLFQTVTCDFCILRLGRRIFVKSSLLKTSFTYNIFFDASNRRPLFEAGVSWSASSCYRTGLVQGCPACAQFERHHQCKFGEPTCAWVGGCSQRCRPHELNFITLFLFFGFESTQLACQLRLEGLRAPGM